MAIDKKLIHFKSWNKFISDGVGSEENITTPTSGIEEEGTAIYGQIKGTSIVFIKDVGKIWTHGKVYDGSTINVDELQDKLVSGENIKTINGTSILGEGDIEISGYDDTEIKANLEQAGILAYEAAMRSSRNEQNKVDKDKVATINGKSLIGGDNIVIGGGIYEIKYDYMNGTLLSGEDIAFNKEVFDKLNKNEVSALYVTISIDNTPINIIADSFVYTQTPDETPISCVYLNFNSDTLLVFGLSKKTVGILSTGQCVEMPITNNIVDDEMSDTSENAVQNKVITEELNNKVDKVSGKQLSTEDFTTALKTKLEGMNSFDPTEINNKVNGLQTQIDTLVSGDASTAIESFNEITAFLNGVEDTNSLEGIIAGIEQQIKNKQDAIADLDTIRSGAALGATALQSYTEKYKGTVTGIKVNGSTHNPSNGVVDLGTISANESLRIHFEPNFDLEIGQHIDVTSLVQQSMGITPAELYEEVVTNGKKTALFIHELMGGELQEISRVIDSLYEGVGLSYLSTLDGLPSPFQLIISTTQCQLVIVDMLAGYNSVVVPLTEMVEGKQEQLVSGTNIKTINGESILGSGNITLSAGSGEFATKADLVYAVSKSASQGRLTDPGYYYFNSPTTIDFGRVNQYPRGIYSIVIDGFSTEPLGVFYPLNFIWTNGEPDFASFAGTTKVLEISLFVLDDANSSKKVLATWALFNF